MQRLSLGPAQARPPAAATPRLTRFIAAHPLPPPSGHATRGPGPHNNDIERTPFNTPTPPHSPPLRVGPLPKPDPAPPPPTDTGWMRRPLAPTVPPAQRQPGCSPQNGALKCVCIGGAPSKVFSAPYTQTQTGVHKRALSPPPCAPHRPTRPTPTRTRARAQSAHGYPPQKGLPRVAARCRNVFARNMLQRRSE